MKKLRVLIFVPMLVSLACGLSFNAGGTSTPAPTATAVATETPTRIPDSVNLAPYGTIVRFVTNPKGSEEHNPEIIRDGEFPLPTNKDLLKGYDDWGGMPNATEDWIGYTFPHQLTFTKVVYQEGVHFSNGGWFDNISVQVRQNTGWVTVNATATPPYPAMFTPDSFQIYVFTFDPAQGDGIRIFGVPGGKDKFFSIGELEVWGYGLSGDERVLIDRSTRTPLPPTATLVPAATATLPAATKTNTAVVSKPASSTPQPTIVSGLITVTLVNKTQGSLCEAVWYQYGNPNPVADTVWPKGDFHKGQTVTARVPKGDYKSVRFYDCGASHDNVATFENFTIDEKHNSFAVQ